MSDPQLAPSLETAVFTRADALDAGLTDDDLKRGEYRRVIHGVYCPYRTVPSHVLRCSAVALRMPEDAVITGRSAATLYGAELARPHDPVEVLVDGCKRVFGVRSWSLRNCPSDSVPWSRIRVATPERAAFDLLARNSLHQGVANCDALVRAGLTTPERVKAFMRGRADDGIVRARRGVDLLDGRAESLPESVVRVALVLGGLHPQPQLEIPGEFGVPLRTDLGFEREKVAVEYDGAWHGDPDRFHRDQRRLAWLGAHGWHVIVVTAERLHTNLEGVVEEVRAAVLRRRCGVRFSAKSDPTPA